MSIRLLKHLKVCALWALIAGTAWQNASAQPCACENSEQKIRFYLKGVAQMAGSASVTVTYGDGTPQTTTIEGGSVVWSSEFGEYVADTFECVEWGLEILVEPKCDQPVKIEYTHVEDPDSPEYTEFLPTDGPNPITYFSYPSSPCLEIWFDIEDEQWVQAYSFFDSKFTFPSPGVVTSSQRMKGVIRKNDSQAGDGRLIAGGGTPSADDPRLTDTEHVGDEPLPCPTSGGGGFAPNRLADIAAPVTRSSGKTGTSTGGSVGGVKAATKLRFNSSKDTTRSLRKDGRSRPTSASTAAGTSASSPFSLESLGNGYSLTDPIGRLRWEMSFGSVGGALARGQLIYQAEVLDATAYSPARLNLAPGSDPSLVVYGSNGLQQVQFKDGSHVDIATNAAGFVVSVWPSNGTPALTWTIANPDVSPAGRVRFTRTVGGNSEVHEAQWTGTAHVGGTMTITRFDGKWKEVRDYSLASGNTQRIETVSLYKNNVLQHKARETYQQFNNWGDPGDVFEALVQQVLDPDGKALTTTYQYFDTNTLPANQLFQVTYPDGYSEQTSGRLTNHFWPVTSGGEPLQQILPYKDFLPGNPNTRVANITYTQTPTNYTEQTVTWLSGVQVGFRSSVWEVLIFGSGNSVLARNTYEVADNSGISTYELEWQEISSLRTIFTLDRTGKTQTIYRRSGFWSPGTEDFQDFPFSGAGPALRTMIINGTAESQDGIAETTTTEVSIEDEFGHVVAEETYIAGGNAADDPARLIDRKTHTYVDGRRTATHWNGRLIYEAGFNPDGTMQWEEAATGQRTEYLYDEMKRISQRTTRGRGGDADQVCVYDYDVLGNRISEITTAGALSREVRQIYNLAGELTATVGVDGLSNSISTDYTAGFKVAAETLSTRATRVTSYFKDRQLRSVTGTGVEDEFYSPSFFTWSPGVLREATAIYRDGGLTQLKQRRVINWLGNETLLQTPQFKSAALHDRQTIYDADGFGQTRQLVSMIQESGRATQIFDHDEVGRVSAHGFDLDGNGSVAASSTEPLTLYFQLFSLNTNGVWEDIAASFRYAQDNSTSATLVERTRTTVPQGLPADLISSNVVERSSGSNVVTTMALDRATGNQTTIIENRELGQVITRLERDGRLRSETESGLATRTYAYTALGELAATINPVTGNVTNSYDAATRRLATVTDSLNRQTVYDYYPAGATNAGRVKGIQDPAGNWTYFDYKPAGYLFRQWGVNTYPVEYSYDEAGRMTTLKTFRTTSDTVNWASAMWPDPPGGDITQWIYDAPSGLLERKVYADAGAGARSVSYNYNSGYFLTGKTNARGQFTAYSTDTNGRLTNVTYSDGLPPVTLSYDRAGRMRSVSDMAGTETITWTERDQKEDETYTAGLLAGVTLDRGYDSQFRLSTLGLSLGGTPVLRRRAAYDAKSWADYITDETPDGATVLHKFDYTFAAGKPFVQTVDFLRGATPVMTQTLTRDGLGRLCGAEATIVGGGTLNGVSYQFDNRDRRFEANLTDGTRWNYGYNNRGEVTSGKRRLASNAYAGGEQFEYGFDDIGNRTSAKSGGDAAGANLRAANYTANALNQYTKRDVPGSIWLAGEAPVDVALQGIANGHPFAVERQDGQRFFGEAVVDNSSNAVFARITVGGKTNNALADVEKGNRFVAQHPENFTYDEDGNLTGDGRWVYTWDCENRLLSITARTEIPDAAKQKVEFVYDYLGRRVQKIVSNWNGPGYVAQSTNKFVYDGWNLLAILDSASALIQSFTWGVDLSGTSQGAGGVGGLLAMTVPAGANAGTYYYGFDGNGNVQGMVNAADGIVAARYEYGPFGELIRQTGMMAEINPFQFSTKYQDEETGLLYYGYRFHNPVAGRWFGRDPVEENSAVNRYTGKISRPLVTTAVFACLAWCVRKLLERLRRQNSRPETFNQLEA